jgi:hypothetical protein
MVSTQQGHHQGYTLLLQNITLKGSNDSTLRSILLFSGLHPLFKILKQDHYVLGAGSAILVGPIEGANPDFWIKITTVNICTYIPT